MGYEPYVLTIVGLALGAGGIVKGLIGFGLPIAAIAIMLNFLDPRSALAVLVGPILVTNLWMALRSGDLRQPLRRFWPLICSFVVFLFIG
nr:sulfite exporter TauE/SafE family protein [Alphaproteobacteria bacterium]